MGIQPCPPISPQEGTFPSAHLHQVQSPLRFLTNIITRHGNHMMGSEVLRMVSDKLAVKVELGDFARQKHGLPREYNSQVPRRSLCIYKCMLYRTELAHSD